MKIRYLLLLIMIVSNLTGAIIPVNRSKSSVFDSDLGYGVYMASKDKKDALHYERQTMYSSEYYILYKDSSFVYWTVFEVGEYITVGHYRKQGKYFVFDWDSELTNQTSRDPARRKKYYSGELAPYPMYNRKALLTLVSLTVIPENKYATTDSDTIHFLNQKGTLQCPVIGATMEVVKPFAFGCGGPSYSVDLNTDDSIVVSSCSGIVKGITTIPGVGKLLIVKNGPYLFIYSQMREVIVKERQSVKAGEQIGILMRDEEKYTLNFQIWKEQEKLEPKNWLMCLSPEVKTIEHLGTSFTLSDTFFRTGQTYRACYMQYQLGRKPLLPVSFPHLDSLVDFLKIHKNLVMEVGCHTDNQGHPETMSSNLSMGRARVVVDYLISKGIEDERLVAKGYGNKKLLISDAEINKMKTKEEKEAGNRKNRRTEFKILRTDYSSTP
jgi:outer membrane protein OmpA-like peptidoglycan-associated protein